jgi:hypothetical protein
MLTVRRVVCGYRQGFLPGEWFQTWRRLRQACFDTDVLVAPPDLRDQAEVTARPKIARYRGQTLLD